MINFAVNWITQIQSNSPANSYFIMSEGLSEPYKIILPDIPSAGVYFFTTDSGMQYEVRFGRKKDDILSSIIVFGVINEEFEGEEYVMTNKNEVYRVMSTMVNIILIFRKEHPNVRSYEFTGEPKQGESLDSSTQRIRLYSRYVQRMFDKEEWELIPGKNTIAVQRKNRFS